MKESIFDTHKFFLFSQGKNSYSLGKLFLHPLLFMIVFLLSFSFLLGSIPFGLLLSKMGNKDIRQHGSGNIGATNVLRVMGKRYGIPCFLLDFLKGVLPTLLGISLLLIAKHSNPLSLAFLQSYATTLPRIEAQTLHVFIGLCAILGHNFSPWIGFKGGKGIATSAGVLLVFAPVAVLILLLVWLALFYSTRIVSIASIAAALCLPLTILSGSYFHGKIADQTWNKPLFFFSLAISLLAIYRHKSNIMSLFSGDEHQFSSKK